MIFPGVLSTTSHASSFEPPQRAEINLFIAILFLASCAMQINISQKSKHYWPWLDSQSQIHNRQKEEVPEQLALHGYAERIQAPKFPRTNNSRKCGLIDKIVK